MLSECPDEPMAEMRKAVPLAISLDEETLRLVDELTSARAESRSSIMRAAIRSGLPIVQAGGLAEVVPVDSELQSDVTKVAEWKGLSRGKILLESLKIGISAVNARFPNAAEEPTPDKEFFAMIAANDPDSLPIARDFRRAEYRTAYLQAVVEQVCELTDLPEVEQNKSTEGHTDSGRRKLSLREQIERVKRVYLWAQKNGKWMGLSLESVGAYTAESFHYLESQMLAADSATTISQGPQPKLEAQSPSSPPAFQDATKPKRSRRPRTE
jgi:hypothetical protein